MDAVDMKIFRYLYWAVGDVVGFILKVGKNVHLHFIFPLDLETLRKIVLYWNLILYIQISTKVKEQY